MHRVYTASNFNSELKEVLKNINYGFELLISKEDLLVISHSLFHILKSDIYSKIIISSNTSKKSLRDYNIINRLVDCGAEVYWNPDSKLYNLSSHFILIDKLNLVNKIFYNSSDDQEKQVHYFNEIFNKILKKSEKIIFNEGEIKIDFYADKTIINRNEQIKLSWNIDKADFFNISPLDIDFENKNSVKLQLQKDTLFQITASNKNEKVKKLLFIKVIQHNDLTIDIKVLDPHLKEYIYLTPKIESHIEKFYCFEGQEVVVFCKSDPKIRLSEQKFGKLKKEFEYKFLITKNTSFKFSYFLNGTKFRRRIDINIVKDSNFQEKPIYLFKSNLKRNKLKRFFIDLFKIR
ncbi:MAG: hypothetical protein CBE49_002930 [Rickettsiales bacterium TMED289]|nr:MAG: hypothetical protein CBE49_002930 [Rickettsiales bacterium TMED289]|tara:strand:- start:10238 stop:11281 length:1044 start_codon:yes stop_codon:yes gene_type:complete